MVWLDVDDSRQATEEKIKMKFILLTPMQGDLDHLFGLVLLKDMYLQMKGRHFFLSSIRQQPVLVAEYTSAYKVLEKFRNERIHYAIVIDEYGATAGL